MVALYALWCGFCWLLRGGAFGAVWRTLFNREPGTTVTRIGCAVLMVAPLAFVDPTHALLAVSIYAAMTIGYFGEAMAVNDWRERGLMAAWGIVVLAVALIGTLDPWSLVYAPVGALASVAYAANKPFGGHWTQRAEAATGAIFGATIFAAVM
jgi:hypothetical protein